MRHHQHNLWYLISGIIGFFGLVWFVNTFPPDNWRKIAIFFVSFLISSLLISQYLLNNVRRTFLISLGLTTYLLLRYLNLHHPLYLILLLASLISLEVFFQKR